MTKPIRTISGSAYLQRTRAVPHWVVLQSQWKKEATCKAFLERESFHSFYPVETVTSHSKGKRRDIKRPIIPGYIAMRVNKPLSWHKLLKVRGERFFSGYIQASDFLPFPLSTQNIRAFEQAARRLDDIEAAIKQAALINEGDDIRVVDGPFEAFEGRVVKIGDGKALLEGDWSFKKVTLPLAQLIKRDASS